MLAISNLSVNYGAIRALEAVNCHVNEGEIVALVGANGAGKTTILNTISGIVSPVSGKIHLRGKEITGLQPHTIVKMGISHVPEGRRVFPEMSVLENLQMGAFTRRDRLEIDRDLQNVFKRFPRLEERRDQLASTLSGGEQQMLAIGRALLSRPQLMLMDEPSMGLAPMLVQEIFAIIEEINSQGTTILLVEQNAKMALSLAHRAYVLETGSVVIHGPAQELADDPEVQKAYLGK